MKIRMGFVSNSSSSSFVIITTKENHERVLSAMTEQQREVIGQIVVSKKFLDRDIVYLGGISGGDGYPYDNIDITCGGKFIEHNDDEDFGAAEIIDEWESEVKKNKSETFYWTE